MPSGEANGLAPCHTRSRVRGHWKAPIGLGLAAPQRVAWSRRACRLRQLVQRGCVHSVPALVDQLAQLTLGFP